MSGRRIVEETPHDHTWMGLPTWVCCPCCPAWDSADHTEGEA